MVFVGFSLIGFELWVLKFVVVDFSGEIVYEVVFCGKYFFYCIGDWSLYSYLKMEGSWCVVVLGVCWLKLVF